MKNELKILLTALMFYTRVPVRNIKGWSEEMLNKSTRYFPLIGWLTGGVGALAFGAWSFVFPVSVSVLLSMAATVLFTGAFHEDGFADFCDGFGGGHSRGKILEIMKDSRIGTYGSIGLVLILGTKFFTLMNIDAARIPHILITGHAFSRVFPVLLIYTAEYARVDASSKSKPVGKAGSDFSLLLAIVIGSSALLFINRQEILLTAGVLLSVFLLFRMYIVKKLGGYTGDVLGALQQLCEVIFYLTILGWQNSQ